jgi:hypothetical protein
MPEKLNVEFHVCVNVAWSWVGDGDVVAELLLSKMAAVVKLNRSGEKHSLEGVLACKKRKTENNEVITVFKFAGTVKYQVNMYFMSTYVLMSKTFSLIGITI